MTMSSAGGSNSTFLMAMPLVLGVVGFEQLLHTGPGGPPVYQLLHWLSDSLMALPLGVAAVWLGSRRAQRQRGTSSDTLARACLIAIVFAVLLVPGGIVHEQIDTLTQAFPCTPTVVWSRPAAGLTRTCSPPTSSTHSAMDLSASWSACRSCL